ncbi:MAG: NAD(P)/FAD-dependent oxidoreductase [Bacteroidetes bacterium]|nr:NAD(P)/FAD-dependent oxidoreductase [Bacteroidota bacterium]
MKIAVIGGGAAGFFAAISCRNHFSNAQVVILEKSSKVLSKVKISGGGRCNVTNACFDNKLLSHHYPRGENQLRKAFEQFNAADIIDWFESRAVKMKVYPDNCVFPLANDSQAIIDCFLNETKRLKIEVQLNQRIHQISKSENSFLIQTEEATLEFDCLIVTIGGQPKASGFNLMESFGHHVVEPVPSLFTFNMPKNPICELMGNVVEHTTVKVEGTKLLGQGPLLITHWGMSGPAILKLSAWGARILYEKNYNFAILVNWLNEEKEDDLRVQLLRYMLEQGGKMVYNFNPFPITNRLWYFLLEKSEISLEMRWKDLGKKNINKLVNTLLNDRYEVSGKTTFKEEFVTAGGISLNEIDFKSMESRIVKGLFFAGEVLDIDGITGGFNFQAAWTTGFIAGKNVGLEN